MVHKGEILRVIVVVTLLGWISVKLAVAEKRVSTDNQSPKISQHLVIRLIQNKIKDIHWLARYPLIIEAVKEQNASAMTLDQIHQLDLQWVAAEVATEFQTALHESKVGTFIKRMLKKKSDFSEIILTDGQGANVAAYPITSDYWQGDELKWQHAFNDGAGSTYVGPVQFDESTKLKVVQVAVPVKDEEATIGVLIVGVKFSYIESKRLKNKKWRNRFLTESEE